MPNHWRARNGPSASAVFIQWHAISHLPQYLQVETQFRTIGPAVIPVHLELPDHDGQLQTVLV